MRTSFPFKILSQVINLNNEFELDFILQLSANISKILFCYANFNFLPINQIFKKTMLIFPKHNKLWPLPLTLPNLRLLSSEDAKIFENHLKPVMLVFIGQHLWSTLR